MGHRALVAVERPGGRYDCYRSQWGADSARFSTADRGQAIDRLAAERPPLATRLSAAGALARLDPRTDEALFVRGDGTAAYLVVALPTVSADPSSVPRRPPAALVPVDGASDAAAVRRFVRAVKGVLGDAVDAGIVPEAAARGYLAARVARHPDVAAEPLWLPGDPERADRPPDDTEP